MSDYALEGPKWAMPSSITWSFASDGDTRFSGSISSTYQNTVLAALAKWSQVSGIGFQQVTPGTPGVDIVIGWQKFGASASQVGDTEYSYLGSGNNETFTSVQVSAEDPAERALTPAGNGSFIYANTSTTLYQTVLHELGHALGLAHSTNMVEVMYPSLGTQDRDLGTGDIAGIQSLYPSSHPASSTPVMASTAPQTVAMTSQTSQTPQQTSQTPTAQTQTVQTTQAMQPQPITATREQVAIHRYFDTTDGTHFYTGSTDEQAGISANRPDLVAEGTSFMSAASTNTSAVPVYRFFNSVYGTHFYTDSSDERNAVSATRADMIYEGVSFYADSTQQAGDVPVFRFFDGHTGTHLYTSNASEASSISATLPQYHSEGVAFWAPAARSV